MDMQTTNTYLGNADFETRSAVLKAMATQAGLRLPTTRLPEGTALWDVGDEHKRQLASSINALPDAMDAIQALRARIQAEQHIDREVLVPTLRMDPVRGKLTREEGGKVTAPVGYTRAGFSQVIQAVRPAGLTNLSENLLALPPAIRSQAFNWHAGQKGIANASPARIRTMVDPNSGARVVRAVTSLRHSAETGDDAAIATCIQAQDVFKGAKARITRELDRSEFELIWPAMNRQLVVGDIALVGCRFVNSETKAGALRCEAFLLRALCANFTTAESFDVDDEEISLRHIGDLSRKLNAALGRALARIDPFVKAFADAYRTELPAPTRAEALALVGKKYDVSTRLLQAAADAWNQDGDAGAGDTLAGLVNALTRASQLEPVAVAAEIERVAGKLLTRGI